MQCQHSDNLPMAFYSGSNKDDSPKMCIGSHMIFAAGQNINFNIKKFLPFVATSRLGENSPENTGGIRKNQ